MKVDPGLVAMTSLRAAAVLFVAVAVLCISDARKLKDKCEFVKLLKATKIMPANQIATWSCIAYHESKYVTQATSPANKDGSRDHGILQINDRWWCSPPNKGKGCNVSCAALKTDNIRPSVVCARKIWLETKRLKKNGFKAWSTYKFCDTPAKVKPYNC